MKSSLTLKLLGSFLLVIAISAVLIYTQTWQATQQAFRIYTTQNSQAWAKSLVSTFANYYAKENTWAGVESILQTDEDDQEESSGMGHGYGQGMMGGMHNNMSKWMGQMMGQRLILADALGVVQLDTDGNLTGETLTTEEISAGEAVNVDGSLVGTLIVTPAGSVSAGTDASSLFLNSINRSIVIVVVVASLVSFILVLIISLQITAPIRGMQKAAGAIARGDLTQRVTVQSNDELGNLASSFNNMADSLAHAEDQRRRLLADVAHELRTPLAAIQATAEGIQDGVLPLDVSQVDAIHDESLLLGRLIEDLRLISLAEAGELRLERQPTDLANLLAKVGERMRPQCHNRGVDLIVNVEEELPLVSLDSDRITQVINNLVTNALRYTPSGGRITLQAGPLIGSDRGVIVSVADTGCGIAEEDLPWIFDRFYRADKSRTRGSGGSGLGLSIVKQLVEAHGGKVSATSQLGVGTKIAFQIAG